MKNLYEQMPIETWKKIAYVVQKLKLVDFSHEEYDENLKLFKKLLSDVDLYLEIKSKNPKCKDDIGLASLLSSIYKTKCNDGYTKAAFFEYIYTLSALGIKTMAFNPLDFPTNIGCMQLTHNDLDKVEGIKKCYTDGTFHLDSYSIKTEDCYDLTKLENASYLITTEFQAANKHTKILNAEAIVNSFVGGTLPSKDEFLKFDFPKLYVAEQVFNWMGSPNYKQVFNHFEAENLSCSKRLTKNDNGYYYK